MEISDFFSFYHGYVIHQECLHRHRGIDTLIKQMKDIVLFFSVSIKKQGKQRYRMQYCIALHYLYTVRQFVSYLHYLGTITNYTIILKH